MADSLPSILHVVAPAPVGGLESVVRLLAREQVRAGHEVRVALITGLTGDAHPLAQLLRADGLTVDVLAFPDRAYASQWRALRALGRSMRPDIAHTHGYHPDLLAPSALRPTGASMVATFHGFTGGSAKGRLYEWLQLRAARSLDAAIAVSVAIGTRLEQSGVPTARVHLVPNAIAPIAGALSRADARAELGLPLEGFVVGWVGRVSPEKGPDVFVDALQRLPRTDVQAAVLGDGSARVDAERRARDAGLAGRLHWCGLRSQAGRLLAAFDVVALSSRTEGTPMILLEAMAAGIPVVATAVGGVPDLVRPEDGLLVPAEDPAALAMALNAVVDDPDAARARAQHARHRIEAHYAPAPWVARHAAVYADARAARRR